MASDVPEPSWRPPAAPPKAPLTRDAILDAALEVLDREGMDGLSMRKVAEELGTGAASLYWHVKNKEELLQLLFERATQEMTLPEPDPSRWQEQVKEMAREARRNLEKHRDLARISLGRIPAGPSVAILLEWMFRLLQPVGIPDQVIAYAGDVAALYVGAYAFEESLGFPSPTGEDMPPEQIVAMMRDYAASLPEDRFPYTRAAADLIFTNDPDRFEFGLDLLVRGLATYANTKS